MLPRQIQCRLQYLTRYFCSPDWICFVSKAVYVKFSLSPNPNEWGANLSVDYREPDDFIHNPDPKRDRKNDQGGDIFTYRGLTNLGCLTILITGLLALLCVCYKRLDLFTRLLAFVPFQSAGYPIISHFTRHEQSTLGGFNLGGTNASGQVAISA